MAMEAMDVTDTPTKVTLLRVEADKGLNVGRSHRFQAQERKRVWIGEFKDPPVRGESERNAIAINARESSFIDLPNPSKSLWVWCDKGESNRLVVIELLGRV